MDDPTDYNHGFFGFSHDIHNVIINPAWSSDVSAALALLNGNPEYAVHPESWEALLRLRLSLPRVLCPVRLIHSGCRGRGIRGLG